MKQFEVWTVELNPAKGAEINKTRPCLIISPNSMNKRLDTIIVAPLTHTIKNYPSRVDCNFKTQKGQIILDQVRAVDKLRLSKRLGRMDAETSNNACTLLEVMFQYSAI